MKQFSYQHCNGGGVGRKISKISLFIFSPYSIKYSYNLVKSRVPNIFVEIVGLFFPCFTAPNPNHVPPYNFLNISITFVRTCSLFKQLLTFIINFKSCLSLERTPFPLFGISFYQYMRSLCNSFAIVTI